MKITGTRGSKITLIENEDDYIVNIHIKKAIEEKIEFSITKSSLMEEWLIGYTPALYRSTKRKLVVFQNSIACDIDKMQWYMLSRPQMKHDLTNDAFRTIMNSLEVPIEYENEIIRPLNVESVAHVTFETLKENWENIPESTNVAKWHIHKTINAIILEEIWKRVPLYIKFDGITKPSAKSIQYQMRTFHRVNRQYVNTDFKRLRVQSKVVMPIQSPSKLKNFKGLCMTSTPQSEKAGAISELSIGAKLDRMGRFTNIPNKSLSTTSILCPFPQRMAASREVVMCALSQAMYLENPEEPLVQFKLSEQN